MLMVCTRLEDETENGREENAADRLPNGQAVGEGS